MNDSNLPEGFTEAFYGFEMTDEQVGEGPYHPIAIELKHIFESLFRDADEVNEKFFLSVDLQRVLTEFLWRPNKWTLTQILVVSPSMHESITEIARLVAPSLLKEIPAVV